MVDVRREGTQVWLDLDALYPAKHAQPNTVFKSMAVALRSMGSAVSYEVLMGVSGAAFRLQLHERWCPSSPHPNCGFDCTAVALEALKCEAKTYACDAGDRSGTRRAIAAIVTSIDRGHPVLVCSAETGLVVGYVREQDENKLLTREPYSGRGDPPTVLEEWPWAFVVLSGLPRGPDGPALVRSLGLAGELSRTRRTGEEGKYACGFVAYESWIADLRDQAKLAELRGPDEAALSNANAHIYYCLVDARECAAKYLRWIEEKLDGQVRPHLRRAAERYGDIAAKLKDAHKSVVWGWEFGAGRKWTAEMRHAQAHALNDALGLERAAVADLEAAVALLR
jgi:hypothetical protein